MPQLREYTPDMAATAAMGAYDRVMDYLHAIDLTSEAKRTIANRLLNEALREEAYAKMREQFRLKKELEHFAALGDDWDGEGGVRLREASVRNFEVLLPMLSVRALRGIDISPEGNGTLLVTSRRKEAGVNIGDNSYTYYIIKDGDVEGESHADFDADRVSDLVERMTE